MLTLKVKWPAFSGQVFPNGSANFCLTPIGSSAYIVLVNWKDICGVVMPCSNEETTVAELVQAARQFLPKVIVVDDGSTDSTSARSTDAGAQLISTHTNLGKGAALKAGFKSLIDQGYSFALMMDGDGQHRPNDIPAFLQCVEQTGADLVIGNRMPNAHAIPWLRRFVNRWLSARISSRAGCPLPDTQCGFRLVNLKVWDKLNFLTDHFEIESEMLLAFIKSGYRVEFVPIQVVGKCSHSHIRPLADSWRWLRWWWRVQVPIRSTPPHMSRNCLRK